MSAPVRIIDFALNMTPVKRSSLPGRTPLPRPACTPFFRPQFFPKTIPAHAPPRTLAKYGILSAAPLFVLPFSRAQTDLEKSMSPEEFQKSGLSKLTPAELVILDGLLKERRLFQAEEFAPLAEEKSVGRSWILFVGKKKEKKAVEMGEEQIPMKINREEQPAELKAKLVGFFRGLSGSTVFQLDNGRLWQQRFNDTHYLGRPLKEPQVRLIRVWNSYRLIIDDLKMGVAVKRLE